ncbi:calcium-binding protein [Sphingomonas mali]|uniref:calcium-binding protein n=1 Tax=Sphingomonas mali TaxID=40682 RepID=UPI0009FFC63C|nr:calcium-binding protein [Sphingomonas mali]
MALLQPLSASLPNSFMTLTAPAQQQVSTEPGAKLALDYSGEVNPIEVDIAADRSGFYGSVSGNVAGTGSFANIADLSIVMTQAWDFARVKVPALEHRGQLFLDAGEAADDEDRLTIDLSDVRNAIFEVNGSGSVLSPYGSFLNFERYDVTLGTGMNRVRTGDGDDHISSIGSDIIDGGSGVDDWSGNYATNRTGLTFRMEGTSGTLSNGTKLTNIEAYSVVTGTGNDTFEIVNPTTEERTQFFRGGGGFDTLHADLSKSAPDTGSFNITSVGEKGFDGSVGGDFVDLVFRDIEAVSLVFGAADDFGTVRTGSNSRVGGSLSMDGGDGYDTVTVPFLRSGYSIQSDGNGGFIINDIDRSNGDTGWFSTKNFEAVAFADQTVNLGGADNQILLPVAFNGEGDPYDYDNDPLGGVLFSMVPPSALNGRNNLHGTSGPDIIDSGDDYDSITGWGGNDILSGGRGSDFIRGGSGDDIIDGNEDSDSLWGGSGADVMRGGQGDDLIIGGHGADTLTGGDGRDVFGYASLRDTNDIITDFVPGTDRIDLSLIYYLSDVQHHFAAPVQATQFSAGHDLIWYASGNTTVVLGDTDGDYATAELMLTLLGQPQLTASDFIL